jgi:CubicO group peptidase (beta-lactamase class C family)
MPFDRIHSKFQTNWEITMHLISLFQILTLAAFLPLTLSQDLYTSIDSDSPGAVVLWVKDGEVVFRHVAANPNLPGNRPIDPQNTLFRVASISKPFTGLAALSMIRDGLLDPDADINQYFPEPLLQYRFGTPITALHLLTHTAGFDDVYIGKSARTPEEIESLGQSVRLLMPAQVHRPGEVSTYSNFGVALLGYLLETIAQTGFNDVVTERVFALASMQSSTFAEVDFNDSRLMQGWIHAGDTLQPLPFDYIRDAPAGQMLTTVNDIITFLKLLTTPAKPQAPGQPNDEMHTLLQESMRMWFTHDARLQGGYGALWNLSEYSGQALVSHDGGYPGVAARLFYFPEHHQAMFIFSSVMDFGFIYSVTNSLVEAMLPDASTPDAHTLRRQYPSPGAAPRIEDGLRLSDFAGHYRYTRYSRNSMLKIGALFGLGGIDGEMRLTHDSTHLIMPDHMGRPRRLVRADTLLFSSVDDDYQLAFRQQNGHITHAFTSGTTALEKIHFLETRLVQFILMGTLIVIMLGTFFTGTIRLASGILKKSLAGWNTARTVMYVVALLYLSQIVLLGVGGGSVGLNELQTGFAYGVPVHFYWANALPVVAVLFTFWLVYTVLRGRTNGQTGRLSAMVFALISLLYGMLLHYWNLIGWYF